MMVYLMAVDPTLVSEGKKRMEGNGGIYVRVYSFAASHVGNLQGKNGQQ
jgi:hypothetical protein